MPYQSIQETELKGLFRLQPKVFGDKRGWYSPSLEVAEFEAATGIKFRLTQVASSFNAKKGVFRGLHYQKPETQGKLVMATSGSVLDIGLDLRQTSPTFGKYFAEILSAENQNQLWLPPGFAHGYLSLEDNTRFTYYVTDGVYDGGIHDKGVNAFDSSLDIKWPFDIAQMNINERDKNWPKLSDLKTQDLL